MQGRGPDSQEKGILSVEDDVFINIRNQDFHDFIEQLSEPERQKILMENAFKIHISISANDYYKHKDTINSILNEYVRNNTIKEYKFVDRSKLDEKIEKTKQKRNRLNASVIDAALKTQERFLNSDQFTIYLRGNINEHKVLDMCEKINTYLIKNNVKAGNISQAASPLSPYINFRQDYFNGSRVDAVLNNDPSQLNIVKQEQENSPLYRFLSDKLSIQILVDIGRAGIVYYNNKDRGEELSFFSRNFDNQRGIERAKILDDILKDQKPILGIIALYALLKYSKSKILKEDIYSRAIKMFGREYDLINSIERVLGPQLSQVNNIAKAMAKKMDKKQAPIKEIAEINRIFNLPSTSSSSSYKDKGRKI